MEKRNETRTVCFVADASLVVCGEVRFSAKAGEVRELRYDQAMRWVTRGLAVFGTELPARPGGSPGADAVEGAPLARPPAEPPAAAGAAPSPPPIESPDRAIEQFFAEVCDEPAALIPIPTDGEDANGSADEKDAAGAGRSGGGGGGDGAKSSPGGSKRPAAGKKPKSGTAAGG
jgi:hypothetical protein